MVEPPRVQTTWRAGEGRRLLCAERWQAFTKNPGRFHCSRLSSALYWSPPKFTSFVWRGVSRRTGICVAWTTKGAGMPSSKRVHAAHPSPAMSALYQKSSFFLGGFSRQFVVNKHTEDTPALLWMHVATKRTVLGLKGSFSINSWLPEGTPSDPYPHTHTHTHRCRPRLHLHEPAC